jgi:hypothetical protein
MNKFFKFLTISSILSVLPNSAGVQACWDGFEYDKYNFRSWLLHTDLIPMQAINVLSYTSFQEDIDWRREDTWARCPFDTVFYTQNVSEWQLALTTLAPNQKIVSKDIHTILYNLHPVDYFRQMKKDSLRENTFVRALKSSKPLLDYLNYAKNCEQLMNVDDPWEYFLRKEPAFKKQLNDGETIVNQSSTHPFVRERTAYQLVKLSHYLGDTTKTMSLYKQFFEKSSNKSWVHGSASYYDAMAHQNPFIRNLLLAYVFETSIDKRETAIKMFELETDTFRISLDMTRSPQERARMMLIPLMKKEGRTLSDIQKNYQVEPRNHLLPIAIQREINKLENWILTNRFTEHTQSSVETRNDSDPVSVTRQEQTLIDARNLKSDLLYFDQVFGFVKTVVTERKQPNMAYWNMAAAHLAFIKKDFAASRQYIAAVKTEKNLSNAIQLQVALTELLSNLYAAPRLNAENEAAILKFDAYLQQNQQNIFDYTTFRSQIMRFLSERFVKDGQVAKGMLILSKSNLTYGTVVGIWNKTFYNSLLETDNSQVLTQAIALLERKEHPNDFDRWLVSEPKSYPHHYGYYNELHDFKDSKKLPQKWNISKLKDYLSMIYVKRDELDSAYAVLKTIPDKHWLGYPYSTYMTENPFRYVAYTSSHFGSDSLPKAAYNKTTFVGKMLELKQQLKTDPKKFEQNYFLLGAAYYNMTHHGNYWLMSEIFWDPGDASEGSVWNEVYYGSKRAAEWFAKGVANCVKKENAAMCCFMANICQDQQDTYEYEVKYAGIDRDKQPDFKTRKTPLWATLKTHFKEAEQYEKNEYWCQHLNELMNGILPAEIKISKSSNKRNNYWYAALCGLAGIGGFAFYRRRRVLR